MNLLWILAVLFFQISSLVLQGSGMEARKEMLLRPDRVQVKISSEGSTRKGNAAHFLRRMVRGTENLVGILSDSSKPALEDLLVYDGAHEVDSLSVNKSKAIQMHAWRDQIIIALTGEDDTVRIYMMNQDSLEVISVGSFPGILSCDLTSLSEDQLIIACINPPAGSETNNLNNGVRIYIMEQNAGGKYILKYHQLLHGNSSSNLLFWHQNGETMLLVSSTAWPLFNNDTSTLIQQSYQSVLYRWTGEYLDILEYFLPANVSAAHHFVVNHNQLLAVAHYSNGKGHRNCYSDILKYSPDSKRYMPHQFIFTKGARDLTTFTLNSGGSVSTFLVVANSCEDDVYGTCNPFTSSRIYCYHHDRFVVFQDIATAFAVQVLAIELENTVLLAIANALTGVKMYQYNGWRFVPTPLQYTQGPFGAGVNGLAVAEINGKSFIGISNQEPQKTDIDMYPIYRLRFRRENFLIKYKAESENWCTDRLKSLEANDYNASLNTAPLSTSLHYIFNDYITIDGDLIVLKDSQVEKIHILSVNDTIPRLPADLSTKTNALKEDVHHIKEMLEKTIPIKGDVTWPSGLHFRHLDSSESFGFDIGDLRASFINGFPSHADQFIHLGEKEFIKHMHLAHAVIQVDADIDKMHGFPLSEFVTLHGHHVMKKAVTFLQNISVQELKSTNTISSSPNSTRILSISNSKSVEKLRCASAFVPSLECDFLNQRNISWLFENVVTVGGFHNITGRIEIIGSVDYSNHLSTDVSASLNLHSPLLFHDSKVQVISGYHKVQNIACDIMKVARINDIAVPQQLLVNQSEYLHNLSFVNFTQLRTNSLHVEKSFRDLKRNISLLEVKDGNLDVMLLSDDLFIGSNKIFGDIQLSHPLVRSERSTESENTNYRIDIVDENGFGSMNLTLNSMLRTIRDLTEISRLLHIIENGTAGTNLFPLRYFSYFHKLQKDYPFVESSLHVDFADKIGEKYVWKRVPVQLNQSNVDEVTNNAQEFGKLFMTKYKGLALSWFDIYEMYEVSNEKMKAAIEKHKSSLHLLLLIHDKGNKLESDKHDMIKEFKGQRSKEFFSPAVSNDTSHSDILYFVCDILKQINLYPIILEKFLELPMEQITWLSWILVEQDFIELLEIISSSAEIQKSLEANVHCGVFLHPGYFTNVLSTIQNFLPQKNPSNEVHFPYVTKENSSEFKDIPVVEVIYDLMNALNECLESFDVSKEEDHLISKVAPIAETSVKNASLKYVSKSEKRKDAVTCFQEFYKSFVTHDVDSYGPYSLDIDNQFVCIVSDIYKCLLSMKYDFDSGMSNSSFVAKCRENLEAVQNFSGLLVDSLETAAMQSTLQGYEWLHALTCALNCSHELRLHDESTPVNKNLRRNESSFNSLKEVTKGSIENLSKVFSVKGKLLLRKIINRYSFGFRTPGSFAVSDKFFLQAVEFREYLHSFLNESMNAEPSKIHILKSCDPCRGYCTDYLDESSKEVDQGSECIISLAGKAFNDLEELLDSHFTQSHYRRVHRELPDKSDSIIELLNFTKNIMLSNPSNETQKALESSLTYSALVSKTADDILKALKSAVHFVQNHNTDVSVHSEDLQELINKYQTVIKRMNKNGLTAEAKLKLQMIHGESGNGRAAVTEKILLSVLNDSSSEYRKHGRHPANYHMDYPRKGGVKYFDVLIKGKIADHDFTEFLVEPLPLLLNQSQSYHYISENIEQLREVFVQGGLFASRLNNVDLERLSHSAIPIDATRIPGKLIFKNNITIEGDLTASEIDSTPVENFAYTSGNHNFNYPVTFLADVFANGDVTVKSTVNGIDLSTFWTRVMLNSLPFKFLNENMSFNSLVAGTVIVKSATVSGVPLKNVYVKGRSSIIGGNKTFNFMEVDENSHFDALDVKNINEFEMHRIIGDCLWKNASDQQTWTQTINFNGLHIIGNLVTNGITYEKATGGYSVLSVRDLVDKILFKTKESHITDDIVVDISSIKDLKFYDSFDGVPAHVFENGWLLNDVDQVISGRMSCTNVHASEVNLGQNADIYGVDIRFIDSAVKLNEHTIFTVDIEFGEVFSYESISSAGLVQNWNLHKDGIYRSTDLVVFTAPKEFAGKVKVFGDVRVKGLVNGLDLKTECHTFDSFSVVGNVFLVKSFVHQLEAGNNTMNDNSTKVYWQKNQDATFDNEITFSSISSHQIDSTINNYNLSLLNDLILKRSCEHWENFVGYIHHLIVGRFYTSQISAETFNKRPVSSLSQILKKTGVQIFTKPIAFTSIIIQGNITLGLQNRFDENKFCRYDQVCTVSALKVFSQHLVIKGNHTIINGRKVQGVDVSETFAETVMSDQRYAYGKTKFFGTLKVSELWVDGLIDGMSVATDSILLKVGNQIIHLPVTINSYEGQSLSSPEISVQDWAIGLLNISELDRQAVRPGALNYFNAPVFFESTVKLRSSNLGEIVHLEDNGLLLDNLEEAFHKLHLLSSKSQKAIRNQVQEQWGWLQVQVFEEPVDRIIPATFNSKTSHLFASAKYEIDHLALIPTFGDTRILVRDLRSEHYNLEATLKGECTKTFAGYKSEGHNFVLTGHACPNNTQEEGNGVKVWKLLPEGPKQLQSLSIPDVADMQVVNLNGRECFLTVEKVRNHTYVYCLESGQFVLYHELAEQAQQVSGLHHKDSSGREITLFAVANHGEFSRRNGYIAIWSYNAKTQQFTRIQEIELDNVILVELVSHRSEVLLVAVSRDIGILNGHVNIYRLEWSGSNDGLRFTSQSTVLSRLLHQSSPATSMHFDILQPLFVEKPFEARFLELNNHLYLFVIDENGFITWFHWKGIQKFTEGGKLHFSGKQQLDVWLSKAGGILSHWIAVSGLDCNLKDSIYNNEPTKIIHSVNRGQRFEP